MGLRVLVVDELLLMEHYPSTDIKTPVLLYERWAG
jgi:hypothetical protein